MLRQPTVLTLAAALAVTALATPLVQKTFAMSEPPAPAMINPAGAPAGMPALTQAEMDYMSQTARAGMLALESSKIAQGKTRNLAVKGFADAEVEEQTTIAEILMSLAPDMPKSMLTPEQQVMLDKLKNTPSGAAFDRAYIDGQIQGHNQLLAIQNGYINTGAKTPDMIVARMAKGRIMDHIKLLTAFKAGVLR